MGLETKTPTKRSESMATSATERNKKSKHTRIVVHYDVGFHNSLYIRGTGANLSWEKGTMLRNTKSNEWVWETDLPFETCEFKVLINDTHYEVGSNHRLKCGDNFEYHPGFN